MGQLPSFTQTKRQNWKLSSLQYLIFIFYCDFLSLFYYGVKLSWDIVSHFSYCSTRQTKKYQRKTKKRYTLLHGTFAPVEWYPCENNFVIVEWYPCKKNFFYCWIISQWKETCYCWTLSLFVKIFVAGNALNNLCVNCVEKFPLLQILCPFHGVFSHV